MHPNLKSSDASFWWAIPRISRTQDLLAGDDFGGVLEVEVQRDPVVEDIDRAHEGIEHLPPAGGAVHAAVAELLEPEPFGLHGSLRQSAPTAEAAEPRV